MLATEAFTWHTVREGLPVLVARLAEVPHEEADISAKTFFRFPSKISNEPLRVEGFLRRHAVPHDGVVEGLALASIEAQDLDVSADSGQQGRQRPVFV